MAANVELIDKMLRELNFDIEHKQPLTPYPPCEHSCGYLDVIDMRNMPDGNYHHMLYYRDGTSRYIFIRPLLNDSAEEIAEVLLNIYVDITDQRMWYPAVLHSASKKDLDKSIVKIITDTFDVYQLNLHLVKFRDPASAQEDFAHRMRMVKRDLLEMMKHKNTSRWSVECDRVAQYWNTSYDWELGESPEVVLVGHHGRRRA